MGKYHDSIGYTQPDLPDGCNNCEWHSYDDYQNGYSCHLPTIPDGVVIGVPPWGICPNWKPEGE